MGLHFGVPSRRPRYCFSGQGYWGRYEDFAVLHWPKLGHARYAYVLTASIVASIVLSGIMLRYYSVVTRFLTELRLTLFCTPIFWRIFMILAWAVAFDGASMRYSYYWRNL